MRITFAIFAIVVAAAIIDRLAFDSRHAAAAALAASEVKRHFLR